MNAGLLFKNLLNNPKSKVLIVKRTGGIGDLLMLSPSLRHLKERFPLLSLSFSFPYDRSSNYNLLTSQWDFLDNVFDFNRLNVSGHDYVVDVTTACIQYEIKEQTTVNRIDLYAHWLGIDNMENKTPVCFPYFDTENNLPIMERPIIGFHLNSEDKERNWDKGLYQKLLVMLHTLDRGTFLIIDDEDCDFVEFSNRTVSLKKLNFKELVNCINELDLLICPDSGPMHIAGALELPCIALFGPTNPASRINYYKEHTAVNKRHTRDSMKAVNPKDVYDLTMSKINAHML